jgi:trimeric autotransporter adhesin
MADFNGTGGNDVARGTNEDDTFSMGSGNDALFGFDGNDLLDGGAGSDRMQGGQGDDSYVVDRTSDVVIEAAGQGQDLVQSFVNHTLFANVENLQLLGDATRGAGNALDNTITGNAGANTLIGAGGEDTLFGADGADTLFGGAGNDSLDGGAGADRLFGNRGDDEYLIDSAADQVIESAGNGTDVVFSPVSVKLGANVEHLRLIGTDDIDATGNGLSNLLVGNEARNVLDGGGGNDFIAGGGGADVMRGGAGNDALSFDPEDLAVGGLCWDGGSGSDTLQFSFGTDPVLDLTAIDDNRAAGIEIIDLSDNGVQDDRVVLNRTDLLALSDTDVLRIDGNAGDAATMVGAGWTVGSDVSVGDALYHSFVNDGATLLVDADVSTAFV